MSSCWDVLNLRETSDRRSIKVAYTSRIKACSPETDPDKFQQLREAYDQAMYISQFLDAEEATGDTCEESAPIATADDRDTGPPAGELAVLEAPAPAAVENFLTADEFMASATAVWEDPATQYDAAAWLALLETEELQDIMLKQELWHSLFGFFAEIVHRDVESNTIRFPQKVIRAYNQVFQWSEDELELQRCFNHDYIQAMMWIINGGRSAPAGEQIDGPGTESKSGWRSVWVWIFILFVLIKIFGALELNNGAAPAAGGDLAKARELAEAGDYREAVDLVRPFAEQGNAYAQNFLGAAYQNGWSVQRDHTEAMRWYELAAEQNFAAAQVNLGLVYSRGEGVVRDYDKARSYYQAAADQGYQRAQKLLDEMPGSQAAPGAGQRPPASGR